MYNNFFLSLLLLIVGTMFVVSCKSTDDIAESKNEELKNSLDEDKKEAAEEAREYLYGDKNSRVLPYPIKPSREGMYTQEYSFVSIKGIKNLKNYQVEKLIKKYGEERIKEWEIWYEKKEWVDSVNKGKIKITDEEANSYISNNK